MTFKVLLVEDEPIVRLGMRQAVPWATYNLELIGEAANGKEALSFLERELVDLVITDLKMPVMDGMALMKEIAARFPACKVIVLTAYEEYPLIREALRLGAIDYLHKLSMRPADLLDVVSRAVQIIERERSEKTQASLLVEEVETNRELLLERFLYTMLSAPWSWQDTADRWRFYGFSPAEDRLGITLAEWRENGELDGFTSIDVDEIHEYIRETARQAGSAWPVVAMRGNCWAVVWPQTVQPAQWASFAAALDSSKGQWFTGHSDGHGTLMDVHASFQQAEKELQKALDEHLANSKMHPTMRIARDYILKHLGEALSLAEVAAYLQLSSGYFGRLFTRQTGEHFVDFVTRKRMEWAQQLLRQAGSSVTQVAQQVGYPNPRYFSRVFRQFTGLTPQEYRNLRKEAKV